MSRATEVVDTPIPGTKGFWLVRKRENTWWRLGFANNRWEYLLVHIPTDAAAASLRRKSDAIAIGKELFAKLPTAKWNTTDVKRVEKRMGKKCIEWLLAEVKTRNRTSGDA